MINNDIGIATLLINLPLNSKFKMHTERKLGDEKQLKNEKRYLYIDSQVKS